MGMKGHFFINREGLREALQQPSSWVLIAVNLGLIAAVIAWDWEVFDIVFLYWAENLVIGAINVLKMAIANPGANSLTALAEGLGGDLNPDQVKRLQDKMGTTRIAGAGLAFKLFLIPFFIVHYGMFCYGHGVFIFSIFGDGGLSAGGDDISSAWDLLNGSMLIAIALLAASHLFSFVRNFIGHGEYRRTHPAALMMRPYGRIVALHITIIFGAMLTMAFGSPLGLLIILMVLKTSVDLAMHRSERKKFQLAHRAG